jgi:hypothetical protein
MRPHQESLLAMRVSAALMSMSAALLVVMLLTGDAQAKVIAEMQNKRNEAIQAAALVTTQQIVPTAKAPSLLRLTAQASIASRVAAQFQPTVKALKSAQAPARSTADLPTMPKLGAIADVPKVNIQPRTVVVVQQAAAQPQSQPQPKVVTKTS